MKIAFLTREFVTENNWDGGLASYIYKTAKDLVNKGNEVYVFVSSSVEENIDYNGIKVIKFKSNFIFIKLLNIITFKKLSNTINIFIGSYYLKKKLLKINKKIDFDIIQNTSYLSPGFFLLFSKKTPPIVTRISSLVGPHREAYGIKNNIDSKIVELIEKITIKKSSGVYSPSILMKKKVFDIYNIKIDLIEPIAFDYKKEDLDDSFMKNINGRKYALFFGTLGILKGIEFIANNIFKYLENNPDMYFVFCGKQFEIKGERPIDLLTRLSREHSSRVIYFNKLKHEELMPILINAHVIVLPSTVDNLPNTLIESMSLGKIVLGTIQGGFDQLITDGENGFLLNFGDNKEFLEKMNLISKINNDLYNKISQNARDTIKYRLSTKNNKKLLSYYSRIIRQKHRR